MAKVISPAGLNVGVEILVDEPNRVITLVGAGNLDPKDGVTLQAVYSKLVQLWATAEYQDSPFPMYAIDALSGQFQIGTDGSVANGWKWAGDTTRDMLRDGGWDEYNEAGDLERVYGGFIGLGAINLGAQPYYILDPADAPAVFPFDDQFNVGVQVYGDINNGNFDKRAFAQTFCREQGKKFADSVLADTGALATGAFKTNFLIANDDDLDIVADDTEVLTAPYDGITVAFYNVDQLRDIGGTEYPFRIIINGNGATKRQIYSKIQYLLRQDTDINVGGSVGLEVTGKTAATMMAFAGEIATTEVGVFIDNFDANDTNDYVFTDQNGSSRAFPYVSAGTLTFNSPLVGAGSSFRLFFKDPPGAGNDWGESGAITVNDADGFPIAGTITSGNIPFTYDYDGNVQGGYTAGTNRNVVLVGVRPGSGKVTVAEGSITRAKGLVLGLVAEQDRIYAE